MNILSFAGVGVDGDTHQVVMPAFGDVCKALGEETWIWITMHAQANLNPLCGKVARQTRRRGIDLDAIAGSGSEPERQHHILSFPRAELDGAFGISGRLPSSDRRRP